MITFSPTTFWNRSIQGGEVTSEFFSERGQLSFLYDLIIIMTNAPATVDFLNESHLNFKKDMNCSYLNHTHIVIISQIQRYFIPFAKIKKLMHYLKDTALLKYNM